MDFVAEVIDQTPNISVITQIEALCWSNPDKNKEGFVKAFIEEPMYFIYLRMWWHNVSK